MIILLFGNVLIFSKMKKEKRFRVTVTQNEAEMAPMKRVRRETQQHQDRLKNLCRKINSGQKTTQEFI